MTNTLSSHQVCEYLQQLKLPQPNSRKGDNGKLLIIGGSELFHAASRWSLEVASRLVDMVFYSSVPSNNTLIKQAKLKFWDGIVVERNDLFSYLEEADCILIGPGMVRSVLDLEYHHKNAGFYLKNPPSAQDWQDNTQKIVNYLLAKFPQKKWAIDAGALQMLDPALLNKNCIITPHQKELEVLLSRLPPTNRQAALEKLDQNQSLSPLVNNSTVLLKGRVDQIHFQGKVLSVKGGNPGMTKGGTGDVLAGLVAGLYCNASALASTVSASHINKLAGDQLHKKVGSFFNATDLAAQIPAALWQAVNHCR